VARDFEEDIIQHALPQMVTRGLWALWEDRATAQAATTLRTAGAMTPIAQW